jgi:hypothetical protein
MVPIHIRIDNPAGEPESGGTCLRSPQPATAARYRMRSPLIAREITRRWISLVPSKIV